MMTEDVEFSTDVADWPLARRLLATIMQASSPWLDIFDRDLDAAAIWASLRLANRAGRQLRTDPDRPASAHGLTLALGLPPADVAMRVRRLIGQGYCQRLQTGLLAVTPASLAPVFAQASTQTLAAFGDLIHELAAAPDAVGAPCAAARRLAARLANASRDTLETHYLSYGLRVLRASAASFSPTGPDPLIFNAVISLAARADDGQTPGATHDHPPVSIHDLAAALGLTHDAVQRRVNRLIDLGVLERRADGVAVPEGQARDEPHRLNAGLIIKWFRQMQASLAAELQSEGAAAT